MTNLKLRSLITDIFGWHPRKAITKKISWELDYRVWNKIDYPVWCQLELAIARPTQNTIEKENE